MKRFEYRGETFQAPHGGYDLTPPISTVLASLSVLGAAGWEVIQMFPGIVWLKREIDSGSDKPPPERPQE